jgi:hypothetical protein
VPINLLRDELPQKTPRLPINLLREEPQRKRQPINLLKDSPERDGHSLENPSLLSTHTKPPVAGPGTPPVARKRSIGASGSWEKPGLKEWGNAWWDALSTSVTHGGDSPEHRETRKRYLDINKQTVEPVADKASEIAGYAALAIGTYGLTKAGIDAVRIARSQFGELSPTVRFGKKVVDKLSQTIKLNRSDQKIITDILDNPDKFSQADLGKLARKNPNIRQFLMKQRAVPEPAVLKPSRGPLSSVGQPPATIQKLPVDITPRTLPVDVTKPLTSPLINLLREEKGSIPLEQIIPRADELENVSLSLQRNKGQISRTFTRFNELDPTTRQNFINLAEGDTELRESAAKASVQIFKNYDDNSLEALYNHLQEPDSNPLPPGMEQTAREARDIMKWSFKEINKLGLTTKKDVELLEKVVDNDLPIPGTLKPKLTIPKWPDNELEVLTEKKKLLEFKLANTENHDAKLELEAQLGEVVKRQDKLENIVYFHQISQPPKGAKGIVAGRRLRRAISKKPTRLLGRKFATREEAKLAGYEVGSLPAAVADVVYETNRVLQMDTFIKHINRNPDFAQRADLAPRDWVKMDERMFPSGKYRKYHPAIAEALEEITYISDRKELTKAYDWLNTKAKIIGFYNPLFMTRYNVTQGIRAAGFSHLKHMPEAMRIYREKGEAYNNLRRNGLFNNVFDLRPAITDTTDALMDAVRKSKTSPDFKEIAKQVLDPINLTTNTWNALNKGTWKADEIQRIATWLAMKDNPRLNRHYSDFEIIELANDFHANYGKVPKRTRQTLNRMIFTPTYKISMGRIVGRMHREPKALWPSLLRHYAIKIAFSKFLPMAFGAYYAYKKIGKRAKVEGYRLIIKEPGKKKETVYSLSDPLLEGKKILNRPWERTIEYNLAAIPSALLTTLRGSLFQSRDPDWKETINAYFKTGAPVLKELMLWEETDKETFQKFMQLAGLAFIYKRNKKALSGEKDNIAKSLLKAMDLWVDWKKISPDKREKRYYYVKKKKKKPVTRIVP